MSLERVLSIGAAGLAAQRTRMEAVASNLANARTTRTPEGGPYRRHAPVFTAEPIEAGLHTVRVERIAVDPTPPVLRFEPGHPDADAAGFVAYPAVDPTLEMIDMLSATRSYEASVSLIRTTTEMLRSALQIVR